MTFKIDKISHSQIEPIAKVIFDSFSNNQMDSGNIDQDFHNFLQYVCTTNVENGLGYVALNDNNEVIGGVLCDDLKNSLPFENVDTDPMMAMLNLVNSKYFNMSDISEATYLQIKFIAVRDDSVGKGIATVLLNAALDNGKQLDFKFAQTESAGFRSQSVFEKVDFVSKAEVKYDEFVFNGATPFKSTTDHESIKLMIKEL